MNQPIAISRPKRIHRDCHQWQALVEEFEASGLSQRAFCQEAGVSYGTFTRWRRRLLGTCTRIPPTLPPADLFVELSGGPVSPAAGAAWDVELQLGRDVVLRLRHPSC